MYLYQNGRDKQSRATYVLSSECCPRWPLDWPSEASQICADVVGVSRQIRVSSRAHDPLSINDVGNASLSKTPKPAMVHEQSKRQRNKPLAFAFLVDLCLIGEMHGGGGQFKVPAAPELDDAPCLAPLQHKSPGYAAEQELLMSRVGRK